MHTMENILWHLLPALEEKRSTTILLIMVLIQIFVIPLEILFYTWWSLRTKLWVCYHNQELSFVRGGDQSFILCSIHNTCTLCVFVTLKFMRCASGSESKVVKKRRELPVKSLRGRKKKVVMCLKSWGMTANCQHKHLSHGNEFQTSVQRMPQVYCLELTECLFCHDLAQWDCPWSINPGH